MSIERVEVLKFGGTSMGDKEGNIKPLEQSCRVIEKHFLERDGGIVVVVSAMTGVTDTLIKACQAAEKRGDYRSHTDSLRAQHEKAIGQLAGTSDGKDLREQVFGVMDKVEGLLKAVSDLQELPPKARDRIVSAGERMSPHLAVYCLREMNMPVTLVDSARVVKTDSRFGDATPNISSTKEKVSTLVLGELQRNPVVMGGFCGSNQEDQITTFSRGGSDLSATLMARVLSDLGLNVGGVYLYKFDVGGVMTADPRVIKTAFVIPHMHRSEASALSGIGGNVIHSKAVYQLRETSIPIYCRSTTGPDSLGTKIDDVILSDDPPVKAVSILYPVELITIGGPGMDRPNIAGRVFTSLGVENIDVRAISQPPTEMVMHIVIPGDVDMLSVSRKLQTVLAQDQEVGDVAEVRYVDGSILGIIGFGVGRPEVLERVYSAMNNRDRTSEESDRPLPIGPGDYEHTLVFPNDGKGKKAIRTADVLHQTLFERA